MGGGDILFAVLAAILLALVVRSFAGRVSAGKVAPQDLTDWRDYAQMSVYALVVVVWACGALLGSATLGVVFLALLVAAAVVYVVLLIKTRNNVENRR